ncbi:MAG: hypothetical protein JJU00_11790 [Opitutales bacterium]|nr:hypothetical protein [Opitutales bacterium]
MRITKCFRALASTLVELDSPLRLDGRVLELRDVSTATRGAGMLGIIVSDEGSTI